MLESDDFYNTSEIDYVDLLKTNYKKIIDIILKSHNSRQKELISICLKNYDMLELNCYCNHVKYSTSVEQLLIKSLNKCKQVCNFCQFHNKKKLFELVKVLKYNKLKEIFTFNYFVTNPEIINFLIDENNTIPFGDLAILLEVSKDTTINENLMKSVLNAFALSNYDRTTESFNVIKNVVTNEKHFEKHTKIITKFVLKAIADHHIEIFTEPNLNNIICSDYVIDYLLEYDYSDVLIQIIDMCKSLNISSKHTNKLTVYEYFVMKKIIYKLVNGVEIVSYFNKNAVFYIDSITLKVNPMNFLDSILTLNDESTIKLLSTRYNTHIKYINEQGDLGYDAGGLTKEFYELLSIEIKKYIKESDGFFMFNDDVVDIKKLRLIGTLLCRSVYIENISPSINLHPIIVFFLMNGGNGINFSKLIDYLQFFDIEYIKNILKIYNMTNEEYELFMYMQCENVINKDEYIAKNLINKYINKNTKVITNAFNYTAQNLWYTKLINAVILQKFISKNGKYDIKSNSIHSLKNNIAIISKGKDYTDENDILFESDTVGKFCDTFKTAFLEVLELINNENLDKLKFFLKFWYGTSSVISFTERKSTVDIKLNIGDFDCFESSTCFDRLYIKINRSLFKNIKNLKQFITEAIDMSIENQKRCEEIGAFMQVM